MEKLGKPESLGNEEAIGCFMREVSGKCMAQSRLKSGWKMRKLRSQEKFGSLAEKEGEAK
jgi:hypothetical protein